MLYNFIEFKKQLKNVAEHLRKELSAINTGQASTLFLDGIFIDSYGSQVAIAHVATISMEDARSLRIVPWDKTNSKEIEKNINAANLGVSVSTDESGLRVFFPPLTTERRLLFTKIIRDKVEDSRIALKGEREKIKNEIIDNERSGLMSEDEKTHTLVELQKIIDETKDTLETMGEKKEKEVMGN